MPTNFFFFFWLMAHASPTPWDLGSVKRFTIVPMECYGTCSCFCCCTQVYKSQSCPPHMTSDYDFRMKSWKGNCWPELALGQPRIRKSSAWIGYLIGYEIIYFSISIANWICYWIWKWPFQAFVLSVWLALWLPVQIQVLWWHQSKRNSKSNVWREETEQNV